MTTHQPIKHSDRTSLPRALIGRRPHPAYSFDFEMGQTVTLLCTDEPAVVVGRCQLLEQLDEFLIQIVGADCDPLWVQPHQIA